MHMPTTVAARLVLPARVAQVIVGLAGALYTFTGLALLFAPVWFFNAIGRYPPFNRHYEGDLGSFLLPLGVGLLLAARNPARHKLLLWVAAAGSLVHAGNHVYDALLSRAALGHWLTDTAPILVFALVLLWVAAATPFPAQDH